MDAARRHQDQEHDRPASLLEAPAGAAPLASTAQFDALSAGAAVAVGGPSLWKEILLWARDLGSLIPGIGTVIDVVSAAVNFATGNYIDGVLDVISMIPGAGDAIAAPLRIALRYGSKRISKTALRKLLDLLPTMQSTIDKACNWLLNNIPDNYITQWALGDYRAAIGEIRAAAKKAISELGSAFDVHDLHFARTATEGFPSGFRTHGASTKRVPDNTEAIEAFIWDLKEQKGVTSQLGNWRKVYQDGYDAAGNKVSQHFFQDVTTGWVTDMKTVRGWSN
jgi:hypothetical protein